MKVRHGFVSNSSSTSYTIVIRDSGKCPHCGRRDPNLLDLLSGNEFQYNDENVVIAKGIEDVEKNLRYGIPQDSEYLKQINKIIDKLKSYDMDEYIAAQVTISYHDSSLNNILQNMIESGSVVVISSEG